MEIEVPFQFAGAFDRRPAPFHGKVQLDSCKSKPLSSLLQNLGYNWEGNFQSSACRTIKCRDQKQVQIAKQLLLFVFLKANYSLSRQQARTFGQSLLTQSGVHATQKDYLCAP